MGMPRRRSAKIICRCCRRVWNAYALKITLMWNAASLCLREWIRVSACKRMMADSGICIPWARCSSMFCLPASSVNLVAKYAPGVLKCAGKNACVVPWDLQKIRSRLARTRCPSASRHLRWKVMLTIFACPQSLWKMLRVKYWLACVRHFWNRLKSVCLVRVRLWVCVLKSIALNGRKGRSRR